MGDRADLGGRLGSLGSLVDRYPWRQLKVILTVDQNLVLESGGSYFGPTRSSGLTMVFTK